ncbi:MAG: HAD family hydrolase, partial [Planctomycetota bacterium]|nr:HAD family hydrolase [Planctomycetota bacterium]
NDRRNQGGLSESFEKMKYKLMALDVDGTLIGPDNVVPPEVIDAVAAADAAELRVCLATGRSYIETIPVWRQLRLQTPPQPMILVGGAMVSEPDTGRTLYQRTIPRSSACRFADALNDMGYSAMALVDAWRHGVDYYLAESLDAEDARQGWFDKMDVKVRRVGRLADAADMPDPLRISAVVAPAAGRRLADDLKGMFDGELSIHPILAPNYGVTIVEAFAARVNKFAAMMYIAQSLRLGRSETVAVGDDINDVEMVRGAALGAAMPGACRELLEAADCVADAGLPAFIRRLVNGEFE